MGIRPEVPFGQWCCETNQGTSEYWVNNLNPGGLRITYNGQISNTWADGRVAALGMLHRLSLYIFGNVNQYIADGLPFDPAPEEVTKAGYLGVASKLQDLAGRWATDPSYANTIKDRLNAAFVQGSDAAGTPTGAPPVSTSTQVVFKKVPHPSYENRPVVKPEGQGWDDLGQRVVRGVVWHRMIGTLRGTDSYFRQDGVNALTDYGVGVAGTDATSDDGAIIRWNDPLGRRSGWASGPVSAPYGDGLAFINKYGKSTGLGVNVVNRDQASIEISGLQYTSSLSQKAKAAIAALTAYWADQYEIPWNVFPLSPKDGFSFVRWHQEFTIGTGKVCPGSVVMDATSEMIEMVRAILKQYQVVAAPTYTKAPTYPWLTPEGAAKGEDQHIGATPVYYIPGGGRTFKVIKEAPRLSAAYRAAPPSGPPIPVGTQFHADYVFRSGADEASYVLTETNGNRIPAANLTPKLQVSDNGRITERDPYTEPKGETIRPPDKGKK